MGSFQVELQVVAWELKGGLQRHWTRYLLAWLAGNHSSSAPPGPRQSPPSPNYSREPNPWCQAYCHRPLPTARFETRLVLEQDKQSFALLAI